jgi:DNA-binding beta-propeller fold protein YncE
MLPRAVVLAVTLAGVPASGAVAQTGTLVVLNKSAATADIIDVGSATILATLPTGQGPHEAVMTADGRIAVAANYGAQLPSLTVIDVPGRAVLRTIDLGEYRRPHGMQFLPGDSLLAVTSETTGNVVLVRIADGTVARAIGTTQRGSHMLALPVDGGRVYTGNIGDNTVSEMDVATGELLRTFAVPPQPEAINVTPDGREVWVGSNATGKVSVVDPATGAVTTAAEGFGWPYRVCFTPDGATVIIPDLRNNLVRFFDRASRREVARLELPDAQPQGIIAPPGTGMAFLSLSAEDRVAVIDLATRKVTRYLPAGDGPDGLAYTARPPAP